MKRFARSVGAWTFTALVLACLASVVGCSSDAGSSGKSGGDAFLSITMDFGRTVMKTAVVHDAGGRTVMEALETVAKVGKAYGGGFVESIDGLSSRESADWFYYVNGSLASVGASLYRLSAGDFVWWDYHRWEKNDFIPAVIGCYPRPFNQCYGGTRRKAYIFHTAQLDGLASEIVKFLIKKNSLVERSGDFSRIEGKIGEAPLMVLVDGVSMGDEDVAGKVKPLLEGAGTFLRFQGGSLVPLDPAGRPAPGRVDFSGAIVATGRGLGDPCPVWVVYCSDEQAARNAGKLLTVDSWKLRHKFGILFSHKGEIGLPLR